MPPGPVYDDGNGRAGDVQSMGNNFSRRGCREGNNTSRIIRQKEDDAMMTMTEYIAQQERVAFARAVCKLNRAPAPAELTREKLDLEAEAKSGAEPYGIRANEGAKFLRALGLPLPGGGTMQPLPPDFKRDSHVITTTTIRPVKIEATPTAAPQAKAVVLPPQTTAPAPAKPPVDAVLPAQAVAAAKGKRSGTIFEQLQDSQARADKAEATLKRLGLEATI